MKFEALVDGIRVDPKKGSVKIALIVDSHVSLDELTSLSTKDETIHVTLESEQTKIEVFPPSPNVGDLITLEDEEAAAELKEAAEGNDVELEELVEEGQRGII